MRRALVVGRVHGARTLATLGRGGVAGCEVQGAVLGRCGMQKKCGVQGVVWRGLAGQVVRCGVGEQGR